MNKEDVEDYKTFGEDFVYCRQHLRPHSTGWCTVSVSEKIALGVPTTEEAYKKCESFKLKVF